MSSKQTCLPIRLATTVFIVSSLILLPSAIAIAPTAYGDEDVSTHGRRERGLRDRAFPAPMDVQQVPAGTPVKVFYDDAAAILRRGSGGIASTDLLDGAESLAYQAVWASEVTYSIFSNQQPTGAFLAEDMTLFDEFALGGLINGFEAQIYRSAVDPGGLVELADVEIELWDGDPLGQLDVPGAGYLGSPIPGTHAVFSDIPRATVAVLKARLANPVALSNPDNRVWMVISSNACRLGWILSFVTPTVGHMGPWDVWEIATDEDGGFNGQGVCCADGSACQVDGPAGPCASDTGGTRGHCSDGDAETALVSTFGGPCGNDINTSSCSTFVGSVYAQAITAVALVPVGNGPNGQLDPGAFIQGDTIYLEQGGTTVLLEARGTSWDPLGLGHQLKAWAVRLDASGYSSGLQGTLSAARIPCSSDADCVAAMGGACSLSGSVCAADSDCSPDGSETCGGPTCSGPGGTCSPVAITVDRNDFIFRDAGPLPAIDISTPDFRWASALVPPGLPVSPPDPYPAEGLCMGSLMLDIPADAKGTFEVRLFSSTAMVLEDSAVAPLMGVRSARITIGTGRCCYDISADSTCVDQVTLAECLARPGPQTFELGGYCVGVGDCPADCNENGIDDADDIANGTSLDCNGNGFPDECEQDCNGNGQADACDLADRTSLDCNGNLIPDECEEPQLDCNDNGVADGCDLADGTGNDCNGNGVLDECDLEQPTYVDCDNNGVPDECEPDCNDNGLTDACDIAFGVSDDCDNNGVPDECDLVASPLSRDCNNNGLLDTCDVAAGLGTDCNGNGTLDQCELPVDFYVESGQLSPIGAGFPQSLVLEMPPAAATDVVLDFTAYADIDHALENVGVFVNDVRVYSVFLTGYLACEVEADRIVLSAEDFNAIKGNGNVVIQMIASDGVDPNWCAEPSYITASIAYTSVGNDCNVNAIPDECEPDCNGNGLPNECDLADGTSVDADGNGVPDECECPPASPGTEVLAAPRNRYLSIVPGNAGQQTALRVTCVDLPAPFDALDGAAYWVGQPHDVSVAGGQTGDMPPTIKVASLGCDPFFTDWGPLGTVHLYHENIIPSGVYAIEAIDIGCDMGNAGHLSAPLALTTSRWGDVAGAFVNGAWEAPDGSVDITDALAVLDAFMTLPWSPGKPRADLDNALPDQRISITDVVMTLDAFACAAYPHPPTTAGCP